MKIFLVILSASFALGLAACSRSDNNDAARARPTPTPNQDLQKDAARLQQATANVAKEREKAAQASATPSASP